MIYSWNNFFACLFMEQFGWTLEDVNCNVASTTELIFYVFHHLMAFRLFPLDYTLMLNDPSRK